MKQREVHTRLAALACSALLLFSLGGCGEEEPPAQEASTSAQQWFKGLPDADRDEFHRQFQKHNSDGFDRDWWENWFAAHQDDPAYEDFFSTYEDDWDSELDDWLDILFGDDEDWEDDEDWDDWEDEDWDADSWFDDIFGDDWDDDDWDGDDWDEDYDDDSWFDILFDW